MIPHSVTAASKVPSEPESVNRIKEGVDDPEKGLLARRLTDFFVEETGHFHNRAPYASFSPDDDRFQEQSPALSYPSTTSRKPWLLPWLLLAPSKEVFSSGTWELEGFLFAPSEEVFSLEVDGFTLKIRQLTWEKTWAIPADITNEYWL